VYLWDFILSTTDSPVVVVKILVFSVFNIAPSLVHGIYRESIWCHCDVRCCWCHPHRPLWSSLLSCRFRSELCSSRILWPKSQDLGSEVSQKFPSFWYKAWAVLSCEYLPGLHHCSGPLSSLGITQWHSLNCFTLSKLIVHLFNISWLYPIGK
jgi:hypothetical protein